MSGNNVSEAVCSSLNAGASAFIPEFIPSTSGSSDPEAGPFEEDELEDEGHDYHAVENEEYKYILEGHINLKADGGDEAAALYWVPHAPENWQDLYSVQLNYACNTALPWDPEFDSPTLHDAKYFDSHFMMPPAFERNDAVAIRGNYHLFNPDAVPLHFNFAPMLPQYNSNIVSNVAAAFPTNYVPDNSVMEHLTDENNCNDIQEMEINTHRYLLVPPQVISNDMPANSFTNVSTTETAAASTTADPSFTVDDSTSTAIDPVAYLSSNQVADIASTISSADDDTTTLICHTTTRTSTSSRADDVTSTSSIITASITSTFFSAADVTNTLISSTAGVTSTSGSAAVLTFTTPFSTAAVTTTHPPEVTAPPGGTCYSSRATGPSTSIASNAATRTRTRTTNTNKLREMERITKSLCEALPFFPLYKDKEKYVLPAVAIEKNVYPLVPNADNNQEDQELKKYDKYGKNKRSKLITIGPCSKKEHVNIIFVGHVDAGKSTIGGHLMYLTGKVDKRTLDKYEREAKVKSRESWYLSWALDTSEEERDRGKTVETGRGSFETATKHFTVLDAPGHKSFVPNMICGAAQADIAVLVISARKNEFETGFDKGGQTREHAMLTKTAGVKHLVALVNKMDDPTVLWAEERYKECRDKTIPFLKKVGFKSDDITFVPVSGLTGHGLLNDLPEDICPWYEGPSFIQYLNGLPPFDRKLDQPFVMPIAEKYKDMGVVVMGKVEAGTTHKADTLYLMPNKVQVTVEHIHSDNQNVTIARAGENVKLRLKGIEEEDISPGFVLSSTLSPSNIGLIFDAQLSILDCKTIITKGFSAVMHIHCAAELVTVSRLLCKVNKRTGEKSEKGKLIFVKNGDVAIMRLECAEVLCMTVYKEFPQMGRFTLRDEDKTVAVGKILKVFEGNKYCKT